MPDNDPIAVGVGAAGGTGVVAWILTRVFRMSSKVASIEEHVKSHDREVSAHTAKLDEHGGRITSLEKATVRAGVRLDNIERKLDDVHHGVSDLVKNLIENKAKN